MGLLDFKRLRRGRCGGYRLGIIVGWDANFIGFLLVFEKMKLSIELLPGFYKIYKYLNFLHSFNPPRYID